MTDTQPRQPAGSPTGGQFSTTARTEAEVTLGAPEWETTRQRLDNLVAEVKKAQPTIARLAMKAVAQRVLAAEPRAAHLLLEWGDMGFGDQRWAASEVFDADGERIAWHVNDLVGDRDAGDELYDDVHEPLGDVRGPGHASDSPAFGTPEDRNVYGDFTQDRALLDLRAAAADDLT